MSHQRIPVILIIFAGLCAALLSIITGVAKEQFRLWIEAQPWYSATLVWVLLIVLVGAGIGIGISQYHLAQNHRQAGPGVIESQRRLNRRQIIARVRNDWVDSLLNHSLYSVACIDLGLEDRPDLVDSPLSLIVQEAGKVPRHLPPRTKISSVFAEDRGGLLILGAPGAGKTTLLLELARDLLIHAEQHDEFPIPVLFNLSSWGAVRRAPLDDWLVEAMNGLYQVPRKLAQYWVATEQILPLFDGLDEVRFEDRKACADEINGFRREHFLPIVVCSRTEEYLTLSSRLQLPTAVLIQPLTRPQTEEYLKRAPDRLLGLRRALERDPLLWDLLDTPLMLSIAMLAYQFPSQLGVLEHDTLTHQRRNLFAKYVDAMFQRRSQVRRYTRQETLHWLTWLASSMKRLNQSVFYLEELKSSWLPRSDIFARSIIAVLNALCAWLNVGFRTGLFVGIFFGLTAGVIAGGLVGLFTGLIVGVGSTGPLADDADLMRFRPEWSWSRAKEHVHRIGVFILIGLSSGLVAGLLAGLSTGLSIGLLVAYLILASRGTVSGRLPERAKPNEGVWRTVRSALLLAVTIGLSVGLIQGLIQGLSFGLSIGSLFGLFFLFSYGFGFLLQYWSLRLMLRFHGYAPLRYVRFLEYAAERTFLRRVGGGYIFIHRMLMEYLVETGEFPAGEHRANLGK